MYFCVFFIKSIVMNNTPAVTKNLIVINALCFFAAIVAGKYGIDLNDVLVVPSQPTSTSTEEMAPVMSLFFIVPYPTTTTSSKTSLSSLSIVLMC